MQCPRCQVEAPSDAEFCPECGAKLAATCVQCGTENAPTHKFCKKCGQSLAQADGADSAAASKFASPESYTPKYLAERILTSKAALEGERKQVTVLFADLKGSMELLADRDPEDARALLDAVLTRMMEAVHRYEGTVNQVMGDGIMALFGAPLALEDHALRACYAALAIQNSIKSFAEEARREHGVEVHIRVGLNSGEVVVQAIGSDLRMDYTAVGQTVNLASRMEQLAQPGSIRLTADTLRFAEGFIQAEPLGPVPIKGMSEAVEVFELTGATSGRTRFQATAAGGLTKFVGRRNELEDLQGALNKAEEGHGQIFATVAEAGVGKSRLYWEFTRSHRTKDWMVIESGSVSYGKATAYKPVIDLLKAYFSVEDSDDHRRIREKVTGKVLTLDESLTPAIPPVLSLLEVPIEDEGWTNLDPPQRRQRTLDGVKGLLLREAKVQPLCLVFEDLHWIDTETQALLDSLIESLPGARALLLVNYRPEYEHGWANMSFYTRLRLDPLSSEGAEELLAAILGGDPALDPLKKLLIERTEGNPFYLEESVQTLIESEALVGAPGAYLLTEEVSKIQVPSTVQAILAARMDRLPPEEKRLLQTASVIGTHMSCPLLAAIAEMSEEELNRGLSALQASEFLYETNLFPEREFTFKHALIHEVTYGSLVQETKRALHALVIEAYERVYPDRLSEHLDTLAHHLVRGEVWSKASKYFRPVLSMSPDIWGTGDHMQTIELGQRDLASAANYRNFGLEVMASLRVGLACHALGDYPRAEELFGRNVAMLEGDLTRERFDLPGIASVLSRTGLVLCLAEEGKFAEGVVCAEEAVLIAEGANHPYSIAVAQFGLGFLYFFKGDYAKAIPVLEDGLACAQAADIPQLFPLIASPLGAAYARGGRLSEALPLLEKAVEEAAATKLMIHQSLRTAWLGEAHLLAGRLDEASQFAQRSLELSRRHKERGHEAWALRLLGEIASRCDPPDAEKAEDHYRQAHPLAEDLGMRPLLALCLLSSGSHYRRVERAEQARAELCTAVELFRSMGMSHWLPRAEAELAEAG